MKNIILSVFLCLFVNNALAKKQKAMTAYEAPAYDSSYDFPKVDLAQIKEQIKKSEAARNPAAEETPAGASIKTLNDLAARVHALKTSEDVAELYTDLEKDYATATPEVKFYAATIETLKPFRGFVYRLVTLLQNHSKFVHSQLLTRFKRIVSTASVFLPYEHLEAFIEYISTPYYETVNGRAQVVGTFKNERELQKFIYEHVLKSLNGSIKKLNDMKISSAIPFDQRIIFGADSFKDKTGQYKWIGEFEKNVIMTQMYLASASLSVFVAYNVDSAIDLFKDVGFLYGLDGFKSVVTGSTVVGMDGVSAADVVPVIRSKKYDKLGTLLPNGVKWMEKAHEGIKKAVQIADTALSNVSEDRIKNQDFIGSQLLSELDRRDPRNGLKLLLRIVESEKEESLKSAVNGDIVTINFRKLFYQPPNDLKDFLPTKDGFETKKNDSRVIAKGPGKGETLPYRNYKEGMPKTFDYEHYNMYFPSVKNNDDVFKAGRVLSHQGGSWLTIVK